jgi:hypothetical protein
MLLKRNMIPANSKKSMRRLACCGYFGELVLRSILGGYWRVQSFPINNEKENRFGTRNSLSQ